MDDYAEAQELVMYSIIGAIISFQVVVRRSTEQLQAVVDRLGNYRSSFSDDKGIVVPIRPRPLPSRPDARCFAMRL